MEEKDLDKIEKELLEKKKKLEKKFDSAQKELDEVNKAYYKIIKDRENAKLFEDAEISEIVKDRVYLFRGGFHHDNPKKYMDDVIDEFVKMNNIESYNQWIEIFLDNPWYRVITINTNDFKFEPLLLKKK